ncbi:MAG: chlorophyll a/b-binding protein [Microcoleaceae cyanobacterium]
MTTSEQPKNTPTQSQAKSVQPEPAMGWTAYAEKINGRFAMIGFILLILIEIFTRQDFFTWLGLR